MRAFGLVIVYLRNALLVDSTLKFFNYTKIMEVATNRDPLIGQKFMMLDSQAIEHLDILSPLARQIKPFQAKMTQAERN